MRRAHDKVLDDRLADVTGPRVILAVGEEATGKSRAAFEAVRGRLGDWEMVVPKDAGELADLLKRPGALTSGTVVWMDPAHAFLSAPVACAELRDFLASGEQEVVFIGGLWPAERTELMDGDRRHDQARYLLNLAPPVDVPGDFDEAPLRTISALARKDGRFEAALRAREPGVGITQILAGGHELSRRLREARPGTRAIVHAAMDASRLGCGRPLPAGLLTGAVTGYLDAQVRGRLLGGDWRTRALADAAKPDRVTGLSALVPVADEVDDALAGYRPAAWLDHQGRVERRDVPPPDRLWRALHEHLRSVSDLSAAARQAARRGLYRYACLLASRAADEGDAAAMSVLAEQCERLGRAEDAAAWWEESAAGGDPYAMCRIAQRTGDLDWWERAAKLGDPYAVAQLAERHEREGRVGDAERLLSRAVDAGDAHALRLLAGLLRRTGRAREADEWLRRVTRTGLIPSGQWMAGLDELVRMLVSSDDEENAERVLRDLAEDGYHGAMVQLAARLTTRGEARGAVDVLTRAARNGYEPARRDLIAHYLENGNVAEARDWLEPAAEEGEVYAMWQLAVLAEEQGRPDEAHDWMRTAARRGDRHALRRLSENAGNDSRPRDDVERLWRRAVENGHCRVADLADALTKWGRDAGDLLVHGIEPGGATAAAWEPEPDG